MYPPRPLVENFDCVVAYTGQGLRKGVPHERPSAPGVSVHIDINMQPESLEQKSRYNNACYQGQYNSVIRDGIGFSPVFQSFRFLDISSPHRHRDTGEDGQAEHLHSE